jgi:hypothetical protein
MVRIRARKTCHFSGFIFEGFPFWEFGSASSLSVSENGYGKSTDVDPYRVGVSCRFEAQNRVSLATVWLSLEKLQLSVVDASRHVTDLRTPSPVSDRPEREPSVLCGDSEAGLY